MIHKRTAITILVLVAVLTAVSGFSSDPAVLAQAAEPLPPQASVPTSEWWAAAMVNMQQEQILDAPTGFSTSPDWTVTGQNADDNFGYEVASAGDVNGDGYADVIVGAYGYESLRGRAYVFYGTAAGLNTTWDWAANGEVVGDNFGSAVASAGDVNGDGYDEIIVGAPFFDDGATDNAGKVYVFHGGASGLNTSPDWEQAGDSANRFLGAAVAGIGDNNADGYEDIIVGAPEGLGMGGGQAYIYRGSASGLSIYKAWTGVSMQVDSNYGSSVAGAGDVNGDGYADVIVGAPYYNDGANPGAGKAFVYYGPLSGTYPGAPWEFVGESSTDYLGFSVAAAGDVNGDGYADVIVGAYGAGDYSNQGQVYVFHGAEAELENTPTWQLMGESGGDRFGVSVAGVGDVNGDGYADVVVGASGYSSNQGKAYAYHGGPSGLDTNSSWSYDDVYVDAFGRSVASAGDVNGDGYADLIVGASTYSSSRGRALTFHGAADPPSAAADWYETGENEWSSFGVSVANAGDVNGDGFSDVIVGAEGFPNGDATGKVYLFLGAADGPSHFPDWTATGENADDHFGGSLAGAGDVNGDGYADVIVGASGSGRGMAYVYHGSADGLSSTWAWSDEGESSGGNAFGRAVASAGDVNGDGYADVVVGDPDYYTGNPSQGKAYVYHGSASGLATTPAWSAAGEAAYDYFGRAVAGAGDVNGDGYADVIVGAYGYDLPDDTNAGRAYVYHGSATGLSVAADWSSSSGSGADSEFGWSVAGAGDVNGDGFGDIIAGAPGYSNSRGAVFAYLGTTNGLAVIPAWWMAGGGEGDLLGSSVASAGDANGDGYADVIYGAKGIGTDTGYVNVSAGGAAGLSTTSLLWYGQGESSSDEFGSSVASAGDVNGDGYADLLVGAKSYGGNGSGRAYMYLGNGGGGRLVVPQQARADGSRQPVQPWGLSHSSDSFYLGMWATDPLGRGRVKLEVETCPAGVAFGDAACIHQGSLGWQDVTVTESGIQVFATISGLEAGTLYHWRARVLHAPYSVDQPDITPPPNPAHGPWRRFLGQAVEADLRTLAGGYNVYLPLVVRETGP